MKSIATLAFLPQHGQNLTSFPPSCHVQECCKTSQQEEILAESEDLIPQQAADQEPADQAACITCFQGSSLILSTTLRQSNEKIFGVRHIAKRPCYDKLSAVKLGCSALAKQPRPKIDFLLCVG